MIFVECLVCHRIESLTGHFSSCGVGRGRVEVFYENFRNFCLRRSICLYSLIPQFVLHPYTRKIFSRCHDDSAVRGT